VPQAQVVLHLRAAQVDDAVPRRTVSDRFSSSSWNGGVSAGLSTSTSCASTSTSPEPRFAFAVPAGRARTSPVTRSTNSFLTRSAAAKASLRSGSQTTCARPSRWRRSMKITPPWSRRRCAQPAMVTVRPISAGES
jgi:hypothetical protein